MPRAPAKPKTPLYLINLEGGGDTDITVVNKEVFDWIGSDFSCDAGEYSRDETIPGTDVVVNVTCGSYDNDRALAASAHFTEQGFGTIKAALAYIKEQRGELADEYHGCIY